MEIPNPVTPTQFALICVLSSFLLAWMTTFMWLALRPDKEQLIQREEIQAPLLLSSQLSAPPTRQVITHVQLQTASIASDVSREVVFDGSP